jgi:hypothetical protein
MPTVIRMPNSGTRQNNSQGGGFNICCCRVFTCVNLDFITSKDGLLKLFEVLLGSFCQSLLVKFGLPAAADIGQAFNSFLTTASACLLTSSILLFCYIVSARTFHLVRQSLFEVVFNLVACFMYWSAASYMAFAVTMWLSPRFSLQPGKC